MAYQKRIASVGYKYEIEVWDLGKGTSQYWRGKSFLRALLALRRARKLGCGVVQLVIRD